MSSAAPLVATPAAPVPPGGEAEWVTAADGARLRAALFRPAGVSRGSVVLSGGRTEPIEKYFEVIGELLDRGFTVLVHDWRGQGLSQRALPDRLKGHARGYEAFVGDYTTLLDVFEARLPRPWIAVGHSMGGCLTLLALAKGVSARFAGAVLSAPMLGLHMPTPRLVASLLAGGFSLIGQGDRYCLDNPGKPFDDAFEDNTLTHDRARFLRHRAQIKADPDLALGGPTWGWLAFALKAGAYLARPAHLKGVTIPVVICSAGADKIVVNLAQSAAAAALPKGRFVTVPDAYHEILMETDDRRAVFWAEFDALAGELAPISPSA